MAVRFTELVIDCHDPQRLSKFWCAALDYTVIDEHPDYIEIGVENTTAQAIRERAVPPSLLFLQVPESKSIQNRLHIDVSPIDRERDEEVQRLLDLGARHLDIGQGDREVGAVVLADPEGNEFCVLRTLFGFKDE
ncbi:MAG: VOC family protein [Chloroflexota bacterium]